ncbi:LacI family DNA-binding transcriptional regulator [Quadrisphaera setariae]|uniref:LacI family transcriptional regulator n=1 Tax=Quadrisphaera setariae TaxID=2593304 RepID=A0A5C8Z353_9ACTN|nr:LacI family DNA-binding transcriptional regulator [Quadrisphaera setariae]TXR51611.1 LacI family transcriptional regulator [Quadrisphaera setariae]
MRHPFRVREIAAQAGLSEATVDRALHGRPGVRPSTARQVERAIADLQRQADQLQLGGRTWVLDVVVQAPLRFSVEVRAALEAELPGLRPAVVRARFHLLDGSDPDPVVAALRTVASARSDGVVLKAPQHPDVVAAVAALAEAGVPVVTLVTDLPGSARTAYVGLDNRGAGRTAAHLVDQWLGADRPEGGDVLVVRSGSADLGEDERAAGFAEVLAERRVLEVRDDEVDPRSVVDDLRAALQRDDDGAPAPVVAAVYAMYAGAGGATAVLDALAQHGRAPRVVVVHDLAAEHLGLLRAGRVSAVLHHDLRPHLRRAARVLLQSRGGLPGPVRSWASPVQVVTRFNVPRTGEG